MPHPPLDRLDAPLVLTDGGLETTLVFHDGLDLPEFAAFPLLETEAGRARLRAYYAEYADLARRVRAGFVFESPTWRASERWGARLGYGAEDLDRVNRRAIALLDGLRREGAAQGLSSVVSGCVGPADDAYAPRTRLRVDGAERYHLPQIESFASTAADLVTALTLTYAEEAIGVARAAARVGLSCALSFTVETDGRLPSGETLRDAVLRVDRATDASPAYYMVNCAHPAHFAHVLEGGGSWLARIQGIRANASCMSHAELDASPTLDEGDPADLGRRYEALARVLPALRVVGGCCGTDPRHVGEIARACRRNVRAA